MNIAELDIKNYGHRNLVERLLERTPDEQKRVIEEIEDRALEATALKIWYK